jgi:hypothetical protein
MSAKPNKQLPEPAANPLPVPYAVIGAVWVVALIALNKFYHQIDWTAWVAGPALLLLKVFIDADRIGKIKDNPEPRTYKFHAPGVWAQLDQTLKTLPGFFKNVHAQVNYQNLHPPKGMPLQIDATITMQHPDVDKTQVPPGKANNMKSVLIMHATLMPQGNQTLVSYKFTTDPLLSRRPLDEIIDHIQNHTEYLVKQHTKE